MKKTILILLNFVLFFSFSFGQNENPTILKINGKEIKKDEFLSIYKKNNKDPKYDKESIDNYLDLFTKFKLKVEEAKELKMDTIPKLKKELTGYIDKSAEKYLKDSVASENLIKEAYERYKYEIRASHILFTGIDAYFQALKARKEIINGENFDTIAVKYSKDPSVKENKGDLGYFTVFQMVYPFEEAAYSTKVGEISMPIKTRFGYHLLKVVDKRENPVQLKVAHIFCKLDDKASGLIKENTRKKINEIYNLINEDGSNFEELARKYSEDQSSSKKGGELDWFGSNKMVPEFEKVAINTKNKGDFSKPFLTSYGWHIVKKLAQKPVPPYEKMKKSLKEKVLRGERSNKSKEYFVNKLKKEYKFKDKSKRWIKKAYDAEVKQNIKTKDSKLAFKFKKEKGLFKPSTKIRVSEFKQYLVKNPVNSPADIKTTYKKFTTDYIYNYEKSILGEKYPEYKALTQEFKDGILLFKISNQKVWEKSTKDSVGLETFFKDNQANYTWKKRYDVEIYSSVKKDVIEKAITLVRDSNLSAYKTLNLINKKSQLNLTLEKNKLEVDKKEILAKFAEKIGVSNYIIHNNKYVFIKIIEVLPPQNKLLKETKGRVVSDYQKYLEEEWIKSLKSKYKVEINKDAAYSLGK